MVKPAAIDTQDVHMCSCRRPAASPPGSRRADGTSIPRSKTYSSRTPSPLKTQTTTVVVAGAGPVGLFCALRLAQHNIPVTVLEGAEELSRSPKAYVYQPLIFPEFKKAGVFDDLLKRSAKTHENGAITFRTPRDAAKSIIHQIEPPPGGSLASIKLSQYEVCQVFLEHLRRYDHARVLMGHRVTSFDEFEGGIEIWAETTGHSVSHSLLHGHTNGHMIGTIPFEKSFTAQYLIGADGGRSTVRKLSNIPFRGETINQQLVATDVRYPFEKHGALGANFLIDPEYWGIFGPIDNSGLWRVSFGLPITSEKNEGVNLEEIQAAIPKHFDAMFPGPRPLTYEVVNVAGYRAHQLRADTFRKGRVLLIGDAAHCRTPPALENPFAWHELIRGPVTNPFLALGLVSGLFDAGTLADCLDNCVKAHTDGRVLDAWSRDRIRVYDEIVDPGSRKAYEASRIDAFNHPEEFLRSHPIIQREKGRREMMKKNGGKPPASQPLSTDLAALDGWIAAEMVEKERERQQRSPPRSPPPYSREAAHLKNEATRTQVQPTREDRSRSRSSERNSDGLRRSRSRSPLRVMGVKALAT